MRTWSLKDDISSEIMIRIMLLTKEYMYIINYRIICLVVGSCTYLKQGHMIFKIIIPVFKKSNGWQLDQSFFPTMCNAKVIVSYHEKLLILHPLICSKIYAHSFDTCGFNNLKHICYYSVGFFYNYVNV